MLTPKDLQEISFGRVRFGGYDMKSVDQVLEPLCQDYTTLFKENSVLKSKLKILVEKLEEYRTEEISVKQALIAAQQASQAIVAEAQKKAACILNEAEEAASAQKREALLNQEVSLEQKRLLHAQAEAAAFIDAMEQDIHKHLGLLNALKSRVSTEALAAQMAVAAEAQAAAAEAQAAQAAAAEAQAAAASTYAPVEEPAPAASPEVNGEMEDMDLISAISGAVQEIAGAPKAADIHFDDLQFGKDYSFDK